MTYTIIFSDLDGALLDAADYSFAAAQPALQLVHARRIPLVLCSSKTRAEIEVHRQRLDNAHPFIAENGGGIFIPRGYFSLSFEAEEFDGYHLVRLGMPHAEIWRRFVALRERLRVKVRGFTDMTSVEIAGLSGLSLEEAALAKQRDFDEPFVFDGEPDTSFLNAIEAEGLRWTRGRFFHILGDHDKGRAVTLLQSLYRRERGAIVSIGLGDNLNDLSMLQAVDRPVLVQHKDGSSDVRIDLPRLLRTRQPGPQGWNDAVRQLLVMPNQAQPDRREALHMIFEAALAVADPCRAVLNAVSIDGGHLRVGTAAYDLADYERIAVIGAGKATSRMALAIEELLDGRISAGLVIVKQGHQLPLRSIEQVESSHPVPGAAGVAATSRMLDMLRAAGARTLVICLLSGGASALLVAPAAALTLQDKQQATTLLLNAGASIGELNAVRKHLSAVKGGRLAEAAYPAQLVTLVLSDVIGDRLDVIASGPTAPDTSTFADAWAVIEKYRLQARLPARVENFLRRGLAGQEAETIKAGAPCLACTQNTIVGGIGNSLVAAAEKATQLGLTARIVDAALQGEARVAAHRLAREARAASARLHAGERHCLLYGGETTVTVHGTGKGGRNQELALAFALEIEGTTGISLLSAGTDGTDGPTDAAGAVVDGATAVLARSHGLDPAAYLENNDAYTFFRRLDAMSGGRSHLITGPTGTNVMDLQIVLCERDSAAQAERGAP